MNNKLSKHFLLLGCVGVLVAPNAYAQEIEMSPLAAPEISEGDVRLPQKEDKPSVEVIDAGGTSVEEEEEAMVSFPAVKLRALDKITARTVSFDVAVGETVKFGDIYIRPQICKEPPPIEDPESSAFLQIWEKADEGAKWNFSGWMFASSPALSAMDHPVYDVWVLDCIEAIEEENNDAEADEKEEEAKE